MITSILAPPNNLERPVTEKKAAAPANDNAESATKIGNMYFFMMKNKKLFKKNQITFHQALNPCVSFLQHDEFP